MIIKGRDGSLPSVDLLIPLMHHDPRYGGSMILKYLRCHTLTEVSDEEMEFCVQENVMVFWNGKVTSAFSPAES